MFKIKIKKGGFQTNYKELVEKMVKAVVSLPSQVEIKETVGTRTGVVEIKTGPEDIGRLIGKNGRVINAMRTIVTAASAKEGKSVAIEVLNRRQQLRVGSAKLHYASLDT